MTDINYSNKKFILADVDGTICESCQVISPAMVNQISQMIDQGYSFGFISGTKSEDLMNMISSSLHKEHYIMGTTGTKCVKVNVDKTSEVLYNFSFNSEEKAEILNALNKLVDHHNIVSHTTKEDQVQDRDSQITLSAIGRHASSQLKAEYDADEQKRRVWVEYLKQHLDENKYEMKIAGTTSIDITRKNMDKAWGITQFTKQVNTSFDDIIFFGDKLQPGGNDHPATRVVDCIEVLCPEDTLNKLKKHF